MKAGKWDMVTMDVEGYELQVPTSYRNADQELINQYTGGCGPGKLGDALVPDRIVGESVFLACQVHDWMYNEGETLKDKKIADRVFLVNMLEIIDDGELIDHIRINIAFTYFKAVRAGGGSSFTS